MDDDELLEFYEQLRSVASQLGLAWVLGELDEATTVGVAELRPLRQQTRRGRVTYEELPATERGGPGRSRAEEFVSRRSMTPAEQVDALLDALMRVLVDLDDVAAASVEQLNNLPSAMTQTDDESPFAASKPLAPAVSSQERGPTPISEIDFAPDQGSLAPPISSELVRHDPDRRGEVARILRELREVAHR